MDTSTTIALIALLVSVLFGSYNVWALRHERRDRKQQLDLYRTQIEADAAEREAQKHADVTVAAASSSRAAPFGDYHFFVKNFGPSPAKRISCWLADSAGEQLTEPATVHHLMLGEDQRVTLHVPETVWRDSPPLDLMIEWSDDSGGPYRKPSGVEVAL